ncbi:hypothetical protein EJ04DRAFT_523702 [Polyplosphaeria fusca]|uniref:Uncharacterized protein n=1 Tax=Polyplosphaeria fusca TaxID=682080 RepID=A0A9P4R0V4_9PLEO|nr:hypothetical protein EJ04DRAFT_523702 [Polyplosphaeria fusca]
MGSFDQSRQYALCPTWLTREKHGEFVSFNDLASSTSEVRTPLPAYRSIMVYYKKGQLVDYLSVQMLPWWVRVERLEDRFLASDWQHVELNGELNDVHIPRSCRNLSHRFFGCLGIGEEIVFRVGNSMCVTRRCKVGSNWHFHRQSLYRHGELMVV